MLLLNLHLALHNQLLFSRNLLHHHLLLFSYVDHVLPMSVIPTTTYSDQPQHENSDGGTLHMDGVWLLTWQ